MSNFTTELIKNLSNNVSVEEIFRIELEKAFNQLLETELACFLGYEKYSKDGYNTGDSRNGYYKRTFQTKYGELNLSTLGIEPANLSNKLCLLTPVQTIPWNKRLFLCTVKVLPPVKLQNS